MLGMTDDDELYDAFENEPEPEVARPARSRRPRTDPAAVARSAIREYLRVSALDSGDRAALARLLDTGDSAEDVAVAMASGRRPKTGPLDDVLAVAAADAFDAVVAALALAETPGRLRAAWAVLADAGHVSASMPRKTVLAASTLARTATGLSQHDLDALSRPRALLGPA